MIIKIDDINTDSVDVLDRVVREYIEAIRGEMFEIDNLSNNNNILENAGLTEDFEKIIKKNNKLINSYIENVLVSFDTTLLDLKKFREKKMFKK